MIEDLLAGESNLNSPAPPTSTPAPPTSTTPLPTPSPTPTPFAGTQLFVTTTGLLFAILVGVLAWLAPLESASESTQTQILLALGAGCAGYGMAMVLIPKLAGSLVENGLFGIDINKFDAANTPRTEWGSRSKVPESLGLVIGVVYLVVVVIFRFGRPAIAAGLPSLASEPRGVDIGEYNAALHSICFMLLLGFADDVLELRWRYKLVLPTVATLPLLAAYSGGTRVVVPVLLRPWLDDFVDLGLLYTAYMGCVAIFCTNAINIYAGINGLEAGQSLVIGVAIVIHNLVEVLAPSASSEAELHLFSLSLMAPFVGVTLALLHFNWYPSSVFVGDTFTYFAGMSFAVAAILGHFSKTLMLFFLPQIFNFVLSLYQILIGPALFGVPCPRHRLTRYDPNTGLLHAITDHHNLLNFYLYFAGPLSEAALSVHLIILQIVSCALAFFVRYYVSTFFYDE